MLKEERRYVSTRSIRVEENEAGGHVIKGYVAVFESLSVLMGSFYELITPGAFADSLAVDDIRALYNHDDNCVLGRTTAGTLTLKEDETGLYFECLLSTRSYEQDLAISLERGDITGCSFGFCVQDESVDGESEDGYPIRRLNKIKLVEVSLGVTWPAYPDTSIALRSIDRWMTTHSKELGRKRTQRNRNILALLDI